MALTHKKMVFLFQKLNHTFSVDINRITYYSMRPKNRSLPPLRFVGPKWRAEEGQFKGYLKFEKSDKLRFLEIYH